VLVKKRLFDADDAYTPEAMRIQRHVRKVLGKAAKRWVRKYDNHDLRAVVESSLTLDIMFWNLLAKARRSERRGRKRGPR
jgi:hypothetical protein